MDIFIAETDDWIAVYRDGEKVWENHSITGQRMLEVLDINFNSKWFDNEEMQELGMSFPEKPQELKED